MLSAPATSHQKPKVYEYGMTLVEVLAVLFIVGLMTGLAVLTVPRSAPPERQFATLLVETISTASDRAILMGSPVVVHVDNNEITLDDWQDGQWNEVPQFSAKLSGRFVTQQIEPSLDEKSRNKLVCDPTGIVTQAVYRITGRQERWDVLVDEDGGVRLEAR